MKTRIRIKHTFLLFAFFVGAATVALAQVVNFNGAQNTLFLEPPTTDAEGYDEFIITIDISAQPSGSNVVVNVTLDNTLLVMGDNPAESPLDYTFTPTQVTFTTTGGGASQTITIRVFEEYIGDEDIAEKFALRLTIASGTATLGTPNTLSITIQDDAALPIDLVYFHGRALPNAVELFWQTATEKNNAYMAVERSGDGLHFVEIGQVKPANGPNSSVSQVYKLVDTQPLAAINYYRLRQVDLDEKYTYHLIIAVDYNGKVPSNITLQNNLATADQIQVFFNEFLNGQATLVVVDLNGRIVQQATISADTAVYTVSTTQLAKGYYTVQVQTRTTRDAIQFVKM